MIGNARPTRRGVMVFVALTLAPLGGCGRSDQDNRRPTTTTDVAVTTTTVDPAKQAVLDGYRAYWDAYLASADPMSPDNPALARTATGPALEAVQRSFVALRSAGSVIRGTLDLAPRIVSLESQVATIEDCYGDDTGVYDATSGKREDTPSGQRHLLTATLRLADNTWKVAQLEDGGLGCTAT